MRARKSIGAGMVAAGAALAMATAANDSHAGGSYAIGYTASSCKVGAECTVTVRLQVTADGYHVNKDFNHKITARADGVTFLSRDAKNGANVFSKNGGHLTADERSSKLVITFKADKKGKVDIEGDYRLLVCTDTQCAPETTRIATTVDVK